MTHRYGRVAILITTNKSIRDWTELLAGDEALDAAILDRLLHKAHMLNSRLGNGSFRPEAAIRRSDAGSRSQLH